MMRAKRMKQYLAASLCCLALGAGVEAQQANRRESAKRAPARPIRQYVLMTAQSLGDLERKLRPENKAEDLMGGEGTELRVAIQHEQNKPAASAEVHDASDDVYYVLEGSATLTLGGQLEAPRESEPGEWRAARITGGREVEIRKGDLVVVPRGTPHMRSTVGKDFSMILIKVFAEPQPAPPKKPAPSPAKGR